MCFDALVHGDSACSERVVWFSAEDRQLDAEPESSRRGKKRVSRKSRGVVGASDHSPPRLPPYRQPHPQSRSNPYYPKTYLSNHMHDELLKCRAYDLDEPLESETQDQSICGVSPSLCDIDSNRISQLVSRGSLVVIGKSASILATQQTASARD